MRKDIDVDGLKASGDVGGLIKALDKKYNDRARLEAIAALGRLRDKRAVKPLMKFLKEERSHVFTIPLKEALIAIGPDAVRPLIKALNDPILQSDAFHMLGEIGDPTAVKPLLKYLSQTDEAPARQAIVALGKIGDPGAVGPLVEQLNRGGENAGYAATALGRLGDARAVPALLAASNDPRLRAEALLALAKIGEPQALAPLLVELEAGEKPSSAADALGWLGDPAAIPALLDALAGGETYVRPHAVLALGRIGDRRVIPRLIELLKGQDFTLREAAAGALGLLGDPGTVPALVEAMNHHEYLIGDARPAALRRSRVAAAAALGQIGDPAALDALGAAARQPGGHFPELRMEALRSLASFGPPARKSILPALDDTDKAVRTLAGDLLADLGRVNAPASRG
jgi:HEAT repeat protein